MSEWKLFDDELPTDKVGFQVEILMGDPRWATYYRGMYTHVPDADLKYCLAVCNQEDDCSMYSWGYKLPTHWYPLPEKPRNKTLKEIRLEKVKNLYKKSSDTLLNRIILWVTKKGMM